MKLRSILSGDGMNLRNSPGAIAVTGLTVMRGALGGPDRLIGDAEQALIAAATENETDDRAIVRTYC